MAPAMKKLTRGLYAGDMEAILLTVMIAADEYRVPCEPEVEARIIMFLKRLAKFDAALPTSQVAEFAKAAPVPTDSECRLK
jgi:hypothetical protein